MGLFARERLKPFAHQLTSIAFLKQRQRAFDLSDPGTGKTYVAIEWLSDILRRHPGKKALVFAPLSILEVSWAADMAQFSDLRFSIARARNRAKAFEADADVYITNHDAVKYVNGKVDLTDFIALVIDEIPAYKNPSSGRSKAAAAIAPNFEYRLGMSGTFVPNSVMEAFHPAFIIDDGERLGTKYYAMRHAMCEPKQVGRGRHAVQWVDRPGAHEVIADELSDISIRHKFDDCVDIPETFEQDIEFQMNPRHEAMYKELEQTAVLQLQDKAISAIHAGALANKLLQLASGALYDGAGNYEVLDEDRYDLITELVSQRDHSLIAFLWKHQRDQLITKAERAGIPFAVIDGGVPEKDRVAIVTAFQAGKLQALYCHPQSTAHGLTLTTGRTTIWASPTYNLEHYLQFNRRTRRQGQTKKTEIIRIGAVGTLEERVLSRLHAKQEGMEAVLTPLELITGAAA